MKQHSVHIKSKKQYLKNDYKILSQGKRFYGETDDVGKID